MPDERYTSTRTPSPIAELRAQSDRMITVVVWSCGALIFSVGGGLAALVHAPGWVFWIGTLVSFAVLVACWWIDTGGRHG